MRTSSVRSPVMAILLFAMLLAAAACQSSGGGGTSSSGESPSSPAAMSPEASPVELPTGKLDPGTYSFGFSGFGVSFTLGTGWQHENQLPEAGFELVYGEPAIPPELTAVTIFTNPVAPSEIPGVIGDIQGVTVESEGPASVEGASGTEMLVSVEGKGPEPIQILEIGDPAAERYFLSAGNSARITVLDVDGQALVIAAEGPEAGFDEFDPTAQGVVSSLQIS